MQYFDWRLARFTGLVVDLKFVEAHLDHCRITEKPPFPARARLYNDTMPGAGKKTAAMTENLGRRISVLTTDRERLDGRFLGFDKHMNLVLSDCERSRPHKRGPGFERQDLGFIVLRGELVASIAVQRNVATLRTVNDSARDAKAAAPSVLEGARVSEVTKASLALRNAAHQGLTLN